LGEVFSTSSRNLGGLREVLLDDVGARQLGAQLAGGRVDLEALLEDLHRLGQVALLVELVGDGDHLLDRLARVALARVQVGQLAAHLEVAGSMSAILLQHVAGVRRLAALEVLVDDDLVLALGLHHEALLGVEVGEVQVGSSAVASSLLIFFQIAIALRWKPSFA
jgi:hypothetical protein